MKYHKLDKSMQKCRNWKVMPANCLAPIIKCAYKEAQQQIKEETFQDGDFLQKVHQYLSSPDVLENMAVSYIRLAALYTCCKKAVHIIIPSLISSVSSSLSITAICSCWGCCCCCCCCFSWWCWWDIGTGTARVARLGLVVIVLTGEPTACYPWTLLALLLHSNSSLHETAMTVWINYNN